MDNEERVKILEDEFKLLKTEVKQTLSSVRDFLLEFKTPVIVEEIPLLSGEVMSQNADKSESESDSTSGESEDSGRGGKGNDGGSNSGRGGGNGSGFEPGNAESSYAEPEPESGVENPGGTRAQEPVRDNDMDINPEDTGISAGDIPGENKPEPVEADRTEEAPSSVMPAAYAPAAPPVNMLANLIRWCSEARREIGMAQLPVFLDIYATSGYLAEEMKAHILHLAEVVADPEANQNTGSSKIINEEFSICMEIATFSGEIPNDIRTRTKRLSELILQQISYTSKADIWSQMMLKLHGILTTGGSAVQPFIPLKKADAAEPSAEKAVEIEVSEDATAENNVELPAEGDLTDEEMEKAADQEEELSVIADEIEEVEPEADEPEDRNEAEDEEEIPSPAKNSRKAKLRLVMPVGDGAEQELDLGNLFIATDTLKSGKKAKKASPKRGNG
jgi:hypothetical protein